MSIKTPLLHTARWWCWDERIGRQKYTEETDVFKRTCKKDNIKITQQLKPMMYCIRIYNYCKISQSLLSRDGVKVRI